MRIVDVVVAFPFFVLVIALVFALGAGTGSIYVAISMVGWDSKGPWTSIPSIGSATTSIQSAVNP